MISLHRASRANSSPTPRWATATIVSLVSFLVAATGSATAAAPDRRAPARLGTVVVVDAGARSHPLTHGGSASKFSVDLPAGAVCPGDSANDQWRVQSFLVPAADDPGTLHYGVVGPDGANQYALYDELTHPLVDSLTQANPGPGQPGIIALLPAFDFAVFPPRTLPDGEYRLGIACTRFRTTERYWDTEIVVTNSPGDRPAQLVWRLASAPDGVNDSSDGSGPWGIVAIGVLAAAAMAIGFVVLSRTRRSLTSTKGTP